MKQKIKNYKMYLFGKDDGDYISQLDAQKLMIFLANSKPPKFVLIDGELINTSAIKAIKEISDWQVESEIRELTKVEEETNKKFLDLISNKKLLN